MRKYCDFTRVMKRYRFKLDSKNNNNNNIGGLLHLKRFRIGEAFLQTMTDIGKLLIVRCPWTMYNISI